MAKLIKILLLCIVMSVHSLTSFADEPRIKVQTVLQFQEFPTSLLLNGEYYLGVLISEPTYDQILLDKVELSKLRDQIKIFKDFDIKLEDNFQKYNKITNNKIDEINEILNKPVYESFWDSNKSWIMFGTGLIVGVITYKVVSL